MSESCPVILDPLWFEKDPRARACAGLVSIGLDAYWPQFPGLKEDLLRQAGIIEQQLRHLDAEVINLGLLDSASHSLAYGRRLRQAGIDVLFLHVATYALSSTVLPLARKVGVPIIVLNLAPGSAIDYHRFNRLPDRTAMTGEWLRWCQACSVPEIANVFKRATIPFHQVTGLLEGDPLASSEIASWVRAASLVRGLEETTIGLLGHYYSGMLDIYTDVTQLCAQFGFRVELLEVDELSDRRGRFPADAVARRAALLGQLFDVRPDCDETELRRAAQTSVALDDLVNAHRLGALAYYYQGSGNAPNLDTMTSIIVGTSLLTVRGIPVAGEYEIKNCVAMKIMQLLGCGGSFTEFYAMDYHDDLVLMGHDGPGHPGIAEGKVKIKPLDVYHGKVGSGLSVEMSVKPGPVTLLSVVQDGSGRTNLLVAEGDAVAGPILEIGNPNSRYRFPIGARRFVAEWSEQGPAHHCSVGAGHISDTLQKFALLTGAGFRRVC